MRIGQGDFATWCATWLAIGAFASCLVVGAAALAQGVPLPPPAPKNRTYQPAQPPVIRPPVSVQSDVVRPVPYRPELVPYDESQHALVDRVSLYLSSIQVLSGDFVQIGPDGGRTIGKFYIQKPGRVRFEFLPPSPIDVIADGSFVAVRDRRLSTQDTYPLSTTPLRFLLADRIDLTRDTNLVAVGSDKTFITVIIEERNFFIGTSRLMMMFGARDLQLKQWTVTDPQGYDTTVAIFNLDTAHRPDPGLFQIN